MAGITGVDAFSQDLYAKGYAITDTKNQTNFTGYINALSGDLKKQMVFTDKEQFEIRDKIAALFGSGINNMTHAKLKTECQKLKLNVTIGYQQTSYILDNKNAKSKGTQVSDGSVAVLTITDPVTNKSIKIVDANGNGSIEIEEMFANELLQGISGDIKSAGATPMTGDSSVNGSLGSYQQKAKVDITEKLNALKEKFAQYQEELNLKAMGLELEKLTDEEKEDLKSKHASGELAPEIEEEDTLDTKKEKYENNGYKLVDEAGLVEYAIEILETKSEVGSKEYMQELNDVVYGLRRSYALEELGDGTYAIMK